MCQFRLFICPSQFYNIFAASRENLSLGFPTRSDTNQTLQPQKMGRGLEFGNKGEERLYYLCIEKKRR